MNFLNVISALPKEAHEMMATGLDKENITKLVEHSQQQFLDSQPLYYTLGKWLTPLLIAYGIWSLYSIGKQLYQTNLFKDMGKRWFYLPLNIVAFVLWVFIVAFSIMGLGDKNPTLPIYLGINLEFMAKNDNLDLPINDWCMETKQCSIGEVEAKQDTAQVVNQLYERIDKQFNLKSRSDSPTL